MEALLGFHVGFWDYVTFLAIFIIVIAGLTVAEHASCMRRLAPPSHGPLTAHTFMVLAGGGPVHSITSGRSLAIKPIVTNRGGQAPNGGM
jgi:hypothetical protein